MIRIGLVSDTHGYMDQSILDAIENCDEIWHAGDFGSMQVFDALKSIGKPFRSVFGNIDSHEIRAVSSENLVWTAEEHSIYMTHIGGYPGKYPSRIKSKLLDIKPTIFICGHSHILKVMYDHKLKLLHLNPGACGKEGFHKVRTLLRFNIDKDQVKDMEVVEFPKRY